MFRTRAIERHQGTAFFGISERHSMHSILPWFLFHGLAAREAIVETDIVKGHQPVLLLLDMYKIV
jgi:hypothetical protein